METEHPLWFKNAIIYQLHVKGFFDTQDDGIGDFCGLTTKLDYLESLGITAIWLLPFYPSPLKDDGYDIANYHTVHPIYGTLHDFKNFLNQAHSRGLKVLTELVINHTSDQHRWFQLSRKSPPGSLWRNFYIWSDDPHRYKQTRIIFKDYETSNWTWDPVAKSYYFHRFYSHQPDLNFDSPFVQRQVFRIVNFWLKMGVDGMRLDAIPYLFKQEGTSCENLPQTHAFIKKLRTFVDAKYTDRVLIAEANQWPEDAAAYFGQADECHMAFHFPVMPRLFMAIHMEDRFPIIDILEQTPVLPASCQWIMFLRNHDELTLEMVSDEERDYMYRIYAKDPKARLNLGIRRRLAPLLDNNRAKIELMNILLFSLPGTPVLYYGDEIGMGDNYYLGDRNGVRTPMQWNADKNAGFSTANPQRLYLPLIIDPPYHYELVNVENQDRNLSSLLWWTRHVLAIRKSHKAFGSGSLEFVGVDNTKILAFIRVYDGETVLVVVNLSRFSQAAELDLSSYAGCSVRELFHQNAFPQIKDCPYVLTLGPYGYFWLSLQKAKSPILESKDAIHTRLTVGKNWKQVVTGKAKQHLEKDALVKFLKRARWFERKAYTIHHAKITASIAIAQSLLCIVEVSFREIEETEMYLIPLSFAKDTEAEKFPDIIALVKTDTEAGVLYDAIHDELFRKALLEIVIKGRKIQTDLIPYIAANQKSEALAYAGESRLLSTEQSNSSFIYGKKFIFKLFRRLEEGIHPEVEMSRFLTEVAHFQNTPPFTGFLNYKPPHNLPITIGFIEKFIPSEATAWDFTLDCLGKFYEQALSVENGNIEELIGGQYLDATRILAEKTAELHRALASSTDDPDFTPEPYTTLYQRSLYQEMRNSTKSACHLIKKELSHMPDEIRELATKILSEQETILTFFKKITQKPLDAMKTRIHGDYHLEQVLYTGKDFFIIDFEGEPLHALAARRRKRSPLRDVASMLRSFHYAAHVALRTNARLEPWAELWYERISSIFVQSYTQRMPPSLLPKEPSDVQFLLQAFILEKALYETSYELNVRPEWAHIPLKAVALALQKLLT